MTEDFTNRRDRLSAAKRALLERRKAQADRQGPNRPWLLEPLVPDLSARAEPFPLGEFQKAFWAASRGFFDIAVSGCGPSTAWFLRTNPYQYCARLENALKRLIAHHDMMRATVSPAGEAQRFLADVPFSVPFVDVSGLERSVAERVSRTTVERMSIEVRAPENPPWYDFVICRVSDQETWLLQHWNVLFSDGRTREIITRDLALLLGNPDAALSDVGLSFRDWALHWDRRTPHASYAECRRQALAEYSELPAQPELPTTEYLSPSSVHRDDRGLELDLLAHDEWETLRSLTIRENLTPSRVLLAALVETMALWTRRDRFSVGIIQVPRPPVHPEIGEITGMFQTMGLVVSDPEERTFVGRARALEKQFLVAAQRMEFSGGELIRELRRRAGGGSALGLSVQFDSVLRERQEEAKVMQDLGIRLWGLEPSDFLGVKSQMGYPATLLLIGLKERPQGLVSSWHAPRLLATPLLHEIHEAYRQCLRRLVASPECWSSPTLMGELAKTSHRVAKASAASLVPPRAHLDLLGRADDEPAVDSAAGVVTRSELYALAHRLGAVLASLGVENGSLVGVFADDHWLTLAALLAVRCVGASFAVLDSRLPESDLRAAVARHQISVVLARNDDRARAPLVGDTRMITFDRDALASVEPLATARPMPELLGLVSSNVGDMVYGSEPTLRNLHAVHDDLSVGQGERLFCSYSSGGTVALLDALVAIARGACVVLPDPREGTQALRAEAVFGRRPTVVIGTPRALPEVAEPHHRGLRLIGWSADERIPASQAGRLVQEEVVGRPLYPLYQMALWRLPGQWSPRALVRARLGPATDVEVVSDEGVGLAAEVHGRLRVCGHGLMGVLDGPASAAALLVPHPQSGELCYHSDCLGQLTREGELEVLGRRERCEVWSGGHRIDLLDLAARLEQDPEVLEAVLVPGVPARGNGRPLAFLVSGRGQQESADRLDALLLAQVPKYAVPADYFVVSREWLAGRSLSFVVSSGALDDDDSRAALRLVSGTRAAPVWDPSTQVPAGLLEAVRTLWAEILGSLPDDDLDFFCAGGDSFAVVQLFRRIEQAFSVALPKDILFETVTVRRLAHLVATTQP